MKRLLALRLTTNEMKSIVKDNLLKTIFMIIVFCFNIPMVHAMEGVGFSQRPLSALRETIWPTTNIPVCWENIGAAPANERQWVSNAVANSWEANSNLRFTGWGVCRGGANGIRIRIADEVPRTKGLGRQLDGKSDGMVLNFTFNNWSTDCSNPAIRQACIRSIAVHEFGHALGFSHEQNRADAPGWCQDQRQGSNGDIYMTPYDPGSVMNYCNARWNNGGVLSAHDISGLQQFYGPAQSSGVPWQPDCRQDAILFEHVAFGGKKLHIRGTVSDLGPVRFNDIVSSVCVPPGFRMTVWEHNNFKGRHLRFDGPTNVINIESQPGGAGFNDIVSSVELRDLVLNNVVYETPPNCNSRVVLFEHADFKGRALKLVPGNYDSNYINGQGFNDKVSSLCIPSGRSIELWEHRNFRGRRLSLTGPRVITTLVPRGWNDIVSSVKVH